MDEQRLLIIRRRILLVFVFAVSATCSDSGAEEQETVGNFKNPAAVKEVLTGKRLVANAAWWGFDEDDSTDALQGAINSGARNVIIPYMGSDWIVRPIRLVSNQEILFDPGVVITAKKGEFKLTSDNLFKAENKSNVTLRGYGATLKMQKEDYIKPDYPQGQWRMIINLAGCTNIKVLGLTLKDSGGDGVYIGETKVYGDRPSQNIVIRDCIFDNNYRQGISVESVENLRVDNCIFKNTSGTLPSAGIDIEPHNTKGKLTDIVISNCISANNEGAGFAACLNALTAESNDISILFYNCHAIGCKWGLVLTSYNETGPEGLVEFRNCTSEYTLSSGIWVDSKTDAFDIRFKSCKVKNCASKKVFPQEKYDFPIFFRVNKQPPTEKRGTIEVNDCYVYDEKPRAAINVSPRTKTNGDLNIKGLLYVRNRFAQRLSLGLDVENTGLKVTHLRP